MANNKPEPSPVGDMQTACATAKFGRRDYATVNVHLNSLKLVGGVFSSEGPIYLLHTWGALRPPVDAFVTDLRSKDS